MLIYRHKARPNTETNIQFSMPVKVYVTCARRTPPYAFLKVQTRPKTSKSNELAFASQNDGLFFAHWLTRVI